MYVRVCAYVCACVSVRALLSLPSSLNTVHTHTHIHKQYAHMLKSIILHAQIWRQRLDGTADVGSLCIAILDCEADVSALFDGLPPGTMCLCVCVCVCVCVCRGLFAQV